MNLTNSSIQRWGSPNFKNGYSINVPLDGKYIVNMEPVTIEINTTPKKISEIAEAAQPIYKAAKAAGLKPYINPAAERSGMGHVHIGGASLGENPFFTYDHLLRNVLVYFHKNPALMFGFAEAYDIGMNSNIESYHQISRQKGFQKAVQNYDELVLKKSSNGGIVNFMMQLQASEQEIDWLEGKSKYLTGQAGDDMDGGFFEHYRFINLEHISNFRYYPVNPDMTGKYTVEFRNFRPPPSPEHAQAVAELLLAIMKYQARSNHLEPFEWISPESYELFMTGSAIESNWKKIKQQLKLNNPYLDSMIQEYVTAIHAKRTFAGLPKGIEIFEAYSEKIDKGTRFEVRFDGEIYTNKPDYIVNGHSLYLQKINIGNKIYWIGLIDTKQLQIDPIHLKSRAPYYIQEKVNMCSKLFAS